MSYVQTLRKPVDRIILSHAHTDHWAGLQVLTERFPDVRVFALDGIADQVRARGPARLDGLRRTYGDKAATKVTVPTETSPPVPGCLVITDDPSDSTSAIGNPGCSSPETSVKNA